MAMSTHMLSQMKAIFKYLAQIQQKLDFEIEERQQRAGQLGKDVQFIKETLNTEEKYNSFYA